MRRALVVMTLLMSIQSQPVGASLPAPTPVRSYLVEKLTAEFMFRAEGQLRIFYVGGERSTDLVTGTERLRGEAYQAICSNSLCGLSGPTVKVTLFEVADDYSWANLRLRGGGQTHRLRFVAVDRDYDAEPGLEEDETGCGGKHLTKDLGHWTAEAEGKVFGRRVSTATEARHTYQGPETIEASVHLKTCPP